jgi:hypothetical protein
VLDDWAARRLSSAAVGGAVQAPWITIRAAAADLPSLRRYVSGVCRGDGIQYVFVDVDEFPTVVLDATPTGKMVRMLHDAFRAACLRVLDTGEDQTVAVIAADAANQRQCQRYLARAYGHEPQVRWLVRVL